MMNILWHHCFWARIDTEWRQQLQSISSRLPPALDKIKKKLIKMFFRNIFLLCFGELFIFYLFINSLHVYCMFDLLFSCESREWWLSDRKCDRTQLPWQPVSGSCDGWRRQHLRLARIQQVSLVPYPVRSALHAANRHGHRQDQVLWDLHPSLNFINVS